jgi:hypothetical protein
LTRVVASGVLRLRPYYYVDGSAASWVWYLATGAAPTAAQLETACDGFYAWDNGGFVSGLIPYRDFRTFPTQLYKVRADSLDPANHGQFFDLLVLAGSEGLDPSGIVARQVAPYINWVTLPGSNRGFGRTHLIGLGVDAYSASHPGRLAGTIRPALEGLFTAWVTQMLAQASMAPVLLSYQRSGVVFSDSPISLIDRAELLHEESGTLSRRTLRGSPREN